MITPLCRRWFAEDGRLEQGIHGDYPKAMKAVAKKLDVPCIDLFDTSRRLIDDIGPDASSKYFMNLAPDEYHNYPEGLDDNTHLRHEGAVAFAELIAKGLKKLGGIHGEILLEP